MADRPQADAFNANDMSRRVIVEGRRHGKVRRVSVPNRPLGVVFTKKGLEHINPSPGHS